MKTYSSVKEAIRAGIIPTQQQQQQEETLLTTPNRNRRRHTINGPHPPSSTTYTTTIRLNPDNAPIETLDVSHYTLQDLKRLKREDPFFYYSIPEIHRRTYRLASCLDDDDDEEEAEEEMLSSSGEQQTHQDNIMTNTTYSPAASSSTSEEKRPRSSSRRATLPPNFQHTSTLLSHNTTLHTLQTPIHQGNVTKSRRLSVEAHPDLIVESLFSDDDNEDGDGDDEFNLFGLTGISLNEVDEDEDGSDLEEDLLLSILSGKSRALMKEEGKEEETEECSIEESK
mmetsp:Transcript_22448/g.36943  ORF Transcript_22448/g.36943 Transcript_22448/m.36943 type:complete len:283 (+) Transcript_22448:68-916(+)